MDGGFQVGLHLAEVRDKYYKKCHVVDFHFWPDFVFIIYSRVGRETRTTFPKMGRSWGEACHGELPGPEHAKLRARLLGIEKFHGDTIHGYFAPE